MTSFKRFIYLTLAAVVVVVIGFVVINNYSIIFQRHVSGEIIGMERIAPAVAILGTQTGQLAAGTYSFAIAIRDEHGVIHTASSEDRQLAVARPGFCADAIFYPYPFWNFEKAGTYMNARLIQLRDCPPKVGLIPSAPGSSATGIVEPPPAVAPAV